MVVSLPFVRLSHCLVQGIVRVSENPPVLSSTLETQQTKLMKEKGHKFGTKLAPG
jgi:hypothetical protein